MTQFQEGENDEEITPSDTQSSSCYARSNDKGTRMTIVSSRIMERTSKYAKKIIKDIYVKTEA